MNNNMRYYTYVQPIGDSADPEYVTVSEEDIRREYFPLWTAQMIRKFGEDEYRKFSFEDCLDDWVVDHMAQERINIPIIHTESRKTIMSFRDKLPHDEWFSMSHKDMWNFYLSREECLLLRKALDDILDKS